MCVPPTAADEGGGEAAGMHLGDVGDEDEEYGEDEEYDDDEDAHAS